MNIQIDLRALLPAIRVPTVVLQAADDKMIDPASGPYLAEHIPNARYVEAPGDDHVFFFRTQHEIVDAVGWVLSQDPPDLEGDRFLSTVLVAHPHGEGDEAEWLAKVQRLRGHAVPGRLWAYFDGPIRAMRCGVALAQGASLSFGVHTGEVVRRGTIVRGAAFDVAEAMAALAPAGEVRASDVVVGLVPGSDLQFEETSESLPAQKREMAMFSVKVES